MNSLIGEESTACWETLMTAEASGSPFLMLPLKNSDEILIFVDEAVTVLNENRFRTPIMFNTEGRITRENMIQDLFSESLDQFCFPSNQFKISCDNKKIVTYVEEQELEEEETTGYLVSFSAKNNQLK